MPEHTITIDCVWRNWLGGTVDGLPFAAKICDVNSPDGIDNGRVLKLFLYAEDGEQEIAAYERGWSIYPTGKQEAMVEDVDVLITGDKDFAEIEVERPEICTPAEFMRRYETH